jgi:hypothetical protein
MKRKFIVFESPALQSLLLTEMVKNQKLGEENKTPFLEANRFGLILYPSSPAPQASGRPVGGTRRLHAGDVARMHRLPKEYPFFALPSPDTPAVSFGASEEQATAVTSSPARPAHWCKGMHS